jgi:transposase-like protein
MKCPNCRSDKISRRGKRYNKSGEKQLYLCNNCHRKFIEDDGFKRMRHKKEDIVRAVSLHSDGLSLFKTKNQMWQHDGVKVTKRTISQWTKKYSAFLKSSKFSRAKAKGKATLR